MHFSFWICFWRFCSHESNPVLRYPRAGHNDVRLLAKKAWWLVTIQVSVFQRHWRSPSGVQMNPRPFIEGLFPWSPDSLRKSCVWQSTGIIFFEGCLQEVWRILDVLVQMTIELLFWFSMVLTLSTYLESVKCISFMDHVRWITWYYFDFECGRRGGASSRSDVAEYAFWVLFLSISSSECTCSQLASRWGWTQNV